jgi:sn-glycerol 3-phosphate transport system substrate-binding protein
MKERVMLEWKWPSALALTIALSAPALAATDIDLFFPVPVDGALARNMSTLVKEFNDSQGDVRATAVFTGSYDETLIKTRAASKAGKPPAAVIMSANFLTDLAIEKDIQPMDDLITADKTTNKDFMAQFFPALAPNALIGGSVYGVPFQNSTPRLYYTADQFKAAGLDPDAPPKTWDELTDAAKKLTQREGDRTTRWGIMLPSNYDYGGWILEALTMSNGGRFFNEDYGGEGYYNTPTMLG